MPLFSFVLCPAGGVIGFLATLTNRWVFVIISFLVAFVGHLVGATSGYEYSGKLFTVTYLIGKWFGDLGCLGCTASSASSTEAAVQMMAMFDVRCLMLLLGGFRIRTGSWVGCAISGKEAGSRGLGVDVVAGQS